jgi:hypothetical protein
MKMKNFVLYFSNNMGAFENIKSIEKNSVFTTRGMMKNNDFCL